MKNTVNVIFYNARCGKPHSWLIALFTRSKKHKVQYSHVEIELSDGSTIGSDEADGGVRWRGDIDTNNGCWAKIEIELPEYTLAKRFFYETEGAGYDWQRIGIIATRSFRQLFNYGKSRLFKDDKAKWICNEWVLHFLMHGGVDIASKCTSLSRESTKTQLIETSDPNELYDILIAYKEELSYL